MLRLRSDRLENVLAILELRAIADRRGDDAARKLIAAAFTPSTTHPIAMQRQTRIINDSDLREAVMKGQAK